MSLSKSYNYNIPLESIIGIEDREVILNKWKKNELAIIRIIGLVPHPSIAHDLTFLENCGIEFGGGISDRKKVYSLGIYAQLLHGHGYRENVKGMFLSEVSILCYFDYKDWIQSYNILNKEVVHLTLSIRDGGETGIEIDKVLFGENRIPLLRTIANSAVIVPKIYRIPDNLKDFCTHYFNYVGVDYIVFYLATTYIKYDIFMKELSEILEGDMSRIIVIDYYIPAFDNTYTAGVEIASFDMHYRFWGSFEYILNVDTDEFVIFKNERKLGSINAAMSIDRYTFLDNNRTKCLHKIINDVNYDNLSIKDCKHSNPKTLFKVGTQIFPYLHYDTVRERNISNNMIIGHLRDKPPDDIRNSVNKCKC